MDGIIERSQCEKILSKYCGNESNRISLSSFEVTPLQNQFDGFIGLQYILKLKYGEKEGKPRETTFFMKTLNDSNPLMFEVSKEMKAFDKESFYYDTLLPLMLNERLSCDYVTRSYLCHPYLIVLDDLAERGYRGTGKNVALDFKHCIECLRCLAGFHAGPILYELLKSRQFGTPYTLPRDFADVLRDYVATEDETGASRFMNCSIKGMFDLIEVMPENHVSKGVFKKALLDESKRLMGKDKCDRGFRSTLLHGDLWSNNFLYKYDGNDEIEECKIIDFQTLTYGPPALDVMSFLHSNTTKTFRQTHLRDCLSFYYGTLKELLENGGFRAEDILSEAEFEQSTEYFSIPAKIRAIIDKCLTFISEESFIEALRTEESYSKFLFEDRGKAIRSIYETDENFRNVITEDISELRSMIFS